MPLKHPNNAALNAQLYQQPDHSS